MTFGHHHYLQIWHLAYNINKTLLFTRQCEWAQLKTVWKWSKLQLVKMTKADGERNKGWRGGLILTQTVGKEAAPDLSCLDGKQPSNYPGCIATELQRLRGLSLWPQENFLCYFTAATSRHSAGSATLLGRPLACRNPKSMMSGGVGG